jgi:transcriptional regulator with XRE-family HTH domain
MEMNNGDDKYRVRAKIIGLKIQMARKMLGDTQEEFALKLTQLDPKKPVCNIRLLRMEKGHYPPDVVQIAKIAEISGKEIVWFYTD